MLNGSARRCSTTSTASSQMPGTDRIRFGSWPFESCHTRSMDEIPRHGCNCGMGMVIVALVYEECRNSGPNLHGANCYSWEHFYPVQTVGSVSSAVRSIGGFCNAGPYGPTARWLRYAALSWALFLSAMAYCKVAGIRPPGFNRRGYCRG